MIIALFSNFLSIKSLRFCVLLFLLLTTYAIVAQDVPYKTLIGHSDAVTAVCYSPDGSLIASSSHDKTIKIWRVSDGTLVNTLKGHMYYVTSVCFSPDGSTLASGSWDNTIKIWRVSNGALLHTIKGHNAFITTVCFSPDGKTLASIGWDNKIKIWRVYDYTLINTINTNGHKSYSITFSPDGILLLSGASDGKVYIWRVNDGKLINTFKAHFLPVESICISPDGNLLASGSGDETVKLWRISDTSLVKTMNGHIGSITSVCFSLDGKTLASGSNDKSINVWRVSDGTLIKSLTDYKSKISSICYSPDGRIIASGNKENTVNLWQVEELPPKPLAPANLQVSSIKFNDSIGNNNQILDGNEKASLLFTINNNGNGDAYQLKATINMPKPVIGLNFPKTIDIGDLQAGKSTTVTIPVSGTMQLEAAKAEWNIAIKEGNGFDADPFTISFTTQPFKSPLLSVADYKFTSDEAGKIRLGQTVSLQIMLQNKDQGEATNIKVEVLAPENVFPANESIFTIDKLMPNESKILHYEFFANKKYSGTEIPIKVNITEQYKRYGENRTLSVSLDQNLAKTQLVEIAGVSDKPISINSIYLTSEVNRDIPIGTIKQPNTFALIIGNEDYSSYQKGITTEMNVAYAKNDALTFKEYCSKTLGIPEENITCLLDATAGKMLQEIDRLSKLTQATNGKASVIFYYAGHGLPDEQSKEPYLIPVDVTGSNISAAIKLSTVYEKLTEYPSKQVTVFLDACFSGGARDGALLASRAIRITPKSDYLKGNIVVFTASSGDESAMPWKAQQHGMFTYFLLKKLQETKGDFTYAELNTYLRENVGLESVRTNSKKQNPQVLISSEIEKNWQEWRLK